MKPSLRNVMGAPAATRAGLGVLMALIVGGGVWTLRDSSPSANDERNVASVGVPRKAEPSPSAPASAPALAPASAEASAQALAKTSEPTQGPSAASVPEAERDSGSLRRQLESAEAEVERQQVVAKLNSGSLSPEEREVELRKLQRVSNLRVRMIRAELNSIARELGEAGATR